MAAASTTKGYGTLVSYSDTYGGSYTTVSQFRDITDGGLTIEEVDVSHMASTDQAREKEPDWLNAENITVNLLYNTSQHQILWNLCVGRGRKYFKFVTPDSKSKIIYAFISKISNELPLAGRITGDIEFTVSGLPTLS